MIEEADAINWYQQRIAVEPDEEARQVMSHAQKKQQPMNNRLEDPHRGIADIIGSASTGA
jgi:hypothetical protein